MLDCKNGLPSKINIALLLRHLLHRVELVLFGCVQNANADLSVGVNYVSSVCTVGMEHFSYEPHLWRHVGKVVREGEKALVETLLEWGAGRSFETDSPLEAERENSARDHAA